MKKTSHFDIIIAGAGLAGLTIANALLHKSAEFPDQREISIALVSPEFDEADGRTTALLAHSIDVLKKLEVWPHAAPRAATMSVMRIIDNTGRLWHAPETAFKSVEIGLDSFGYNILNKDLAAALKINLVKNQRYSRINGKIADATQDNNTVSVTLESGSKITANLLIGADGRNSIVRKSADHGKGIGTRIWQYPQTAVVLNFSHTQPHHDTSTEFHNTTGPFTIVPLEERISSLVWVTSPRHAKEIRDMAPAELDREIEKQMHSVLGKTKVVTDVQSFDLSGMSASKMADGRFMLVGEAGHVFPPIGAQGYNLGVRDVETLTRCIVSDWYNQNRIEKSYNSKRRTDILSRTVSVDLFNRSLLSDFVPAQALRSASIFAIREIKPIRKLMMREGVTPGMGINALAESMKNISRVFHSGS